MKATILARAVHGMEWICAAEVAGTFPDARDIGLERREVRFQLPLPADGLPALSTVDDVFVEVGRVGDVGTTKDVLPVLTRRLGNLPWRDGLGVVRRYRALPARPLLDVVVSLEGRRTYNRFAVENAVGPGLARQFGGSYLERTAEGRPGGEADITARILVRGSTAVAALRLAAQPLHRRPYRLDTGTGVLHPPLAAALVRLTGPIDSGVLLDPFCGYGTIPIEALLARPELTAIGADLDPERLAGARRNAGRAGVTPHFVGADAGTLPWRGDSVRAVVTNPPWNVGVPAEGRLARRPERFWRDLARVLAGDGLVTVIADDELRLPEMLQRWDYPVALAQRVRLAGRVSQLVLAAPPGTAGVELPAELLRWRRAALAQGVVTDEGF